MLTPLRSVAATVLAATLALAAVGFSVQDARTTRQEAVDTVVPTFRVRGRIRGLTPGHISVMKVKVRNHYNFPIRLRLVRAKPIAKRASCPADKLRVIAWRGDRRVRPNSIRFVRLKVKLRRSAPATCAGARWILVYAGRAIKA